MAPEEFSSGEKKQQQKNSCCLPLGDPFKNLNSKIDV